MPQDQSIADEPTDEHMAQGFSASGARFCGFPTEFGAALQNKFLASQARMLPLLTSGLDFSACESRLNELMPKNQPMPEPPERVIAILGMHRSGTSLLTGTLEECGLDLGDVNTAAPANAKGNRESWLLMALHEDLLRTAGGGWDNPPEHPVIWKPIHCDIRDVFIRSFAGSPFWGFKDPRLLFCLEGWLERIPKLEMVGVFRHPLEVACSLVKRTPARITMEKALDLWLVYNQKLLLWQERFGFPLVEYDSDGQAFKESVAKLASALGLPNELPSERMSFFDGALRHHEADGSSLPPRVADVFARLRIVAAEGA